MAAAPTTPLDPSDDPYTWLENVSGDEALAWVRERNADMSNRLGGELFDEIEKQVREVLDAEDKIPHVSQVGEHYYNFWRDARHVKGVWRRTTPSSYANDHPEWETVLDLDALAEEEGESWVWHGASVLRPTPEQLAAGEPWRRALVDLSPGGSDTDVTREFDLVDKRFVPAEEGGFVRPAAKGSLGWIDADTVYLSTDFGEGTTTTSGYPRIARLWRRGTPMAEAVTVFEGEETDVVVSARRSRTPGFERDLVVRAPSFFTSETWLVTAVGTPEQELVRIDVPDSANVGLHREWLLVRLRDDWETDGGTYRAGSLLAAPLDAFLAGARQLTVLFAPTATTSLAGTAWTRHHLVVNVLEDVTNQPFVLTPPEVPEGPDGPSAVLGRPWARSELPVSGELLSVSVSSVDAVDSDDVWVTTTGFLTPPTLARGSAAPDAGPDGGPASPAPLKSAPERFEAGGLVARQRFTTSDDGTRVPYFLVGHAGVLDGDAAAPTLLWGYGGFEIALQPAYSGTIGRAWLERGGVYAVANIRGGGEYGPAWHQAALREKRHRAYEDFVAVARDLVATGVTEPGRLGMEGRSNGGLLAGNMLTQYPELFGAVIVGVPLLDMKRYSHLLAGASWRAEYGDPDTDDWEFLRGFSPYHLFSGEREYPPVLFTTSTKDDRVHPGHARKLAALMLAHGKDVTYYENIEGGHGGAADNGQAAYMAATHWTFLWNRLTPAGRP
ncbi:prolyl oligopeptidase family serine peptidase [Myceligenerans pegani]|uniref:S9 family peptidase n=1 Tax=Myceligenerans pegani TaxID=2776917 RepID=A0ABR9MX95_9MICO|nr:prolyl oligopeptidase family serine peptidase [Myceligenerans sp. TRM 65318]MBE1876012.1 S9 family peptidase [Myceligenerans sp. TRM 65318]MBE3018283.1 S9 family peptidase [Myceligenerans sp. TRM 65318]